MTAFVPATAVKAIETLEAAGVPDPRRLLADYAAAGLVRSYAMVIQTIEVDGSKLPSVLGCAVPTDLWQRVISEGAAADVWTGGTVRLRPAGLVGGAPAVHITGIGFHEGDLDRLIDHHRGHTARAERLAQRAPRSAADEVVPEQEPAGPKRHRKPDPAAIPPGAIFATVAQAEAALGFGRTKINEMMNDGRLVRHKIDGATRITVASLQALVGIRA